MTSGNFEQPLQVVHYLSREVILFVGEGNFAFSSMLATSFGSAPNIYATSIDSYDIFCSRYGADGAAKVANLRARGAQVYFGVDITTAASDYSNPDILRLLSKKFDRVVFNYPHAGYQKDLQSFTPRYFHGHHEDLVRNFFQNVKQMLLQGSGEIHITHKTSVYKRWKFNRSAKLCGLSLKRSLLFIPDSFPGYTPCRGTGKNWTTAFPMGKGSRTYIYGIMDWSRELTDIQPRLTNINAIDLLSEEFEEFDIF